MGKKITTRAALLGAVCLPFLPALAQDRIDGVRMNFGVTQRFEFGDNLALENPAEGNSSIASTILSFGFINETDTHQLDFGISGAFRIEDTPDTNGTETDFADPRFRLAYNLQGADSELSVRARYFSSDIDTLSLNDFINEEGILVLPEDFAGLQGNGTRRDYSLGVTLDLFQDAPLGFQLSAGTNGTTYTDTNDPNLFDYNRFNVGGTGFLRFSEVLTGTLSLRYSIYDASNDVETYRTRTTTRAGIIYDISERATLTANAGYTEIVTEELNEPDDTSSSPVGNISYVYAMPNGQITADLDATTDEDGAERLNLVFGRSMELPDGSLGLRFGLTDPQFGDVAPIGSLRWTRNLPAAQISAQLSRAVTLSNEDETQLSTVVALNYDQEINDVSSFGVTATYGQTDGTDDTDSVTRTGLSATYSHALTKDWNLNTGVGYRTREENGQTASSPRIFVSIGRRFDFRP